MSNTVPNGYEDGEASQQVKCSQGIKNKECLLRKVFLFVMLAFVVVVCCISMPGRLNKPASSSKLFGERSLKGLFGLCGKKDDPTSPPTPDDGFTQLTWAVKSDNINLGVGETKKFKVNVSKGTNVHSTVDFSSANMDLYMSFTKTKPADNTATPIECHSVGKPSFFFPTCDLGAQYQDATIYAWIVYTEGSSATTFTLQIGPGA